MKYVKAKRSRQSWSGPFRAKSKPSKRTATPEVVDEEEENQQVSEDESHAG